MAGRPATVRPSGLTGLHYGMFTFVFLTVLATGGFVFELTNVKGEQEKARRAQQDIEAYGRPPDYYVNEARSRNSQVFAVMSQDLRDLATLVIGQAEAVGPRIKDDVNAQLAKAAAVHPESVNATDTMLTALRKLDRKLTETKGTAESLSTQLDDARQQNTSLNEAIKATKDEFQAQVAALNEQLGQLQQEKEEVLGAKDRQITELQAQADSTGEQVNQEKVLIQRERNEMERRLARSQKQIEELQRKVQDLKPSSFDPEAILTQADGRILRAIPGSEVVYVNLGAQDSVKVGMGFEVYSQVRAAPSGLRGKASLEVVTLMESSSECRVTRTAPGQPILEGDIVVNIAYERGRLPKFVVRGDFDLNYDGSIDFDGAEKVKAIIREWGGQIVEELDETTDYVVIGLSPQVIEAAPGQPLSAVVQAQREDKELARSRFKALIDQARSMYIPVITQSQFLFLTGYAGDAVAAR
ncbi:MAG: hypothetical protein KKB50_21230 [Planctomycetes bacterium]|nr:hypothetical protein [Planctomycetota bacterium]